MDDECTCVRREIAWFLLRHRGCAMLLPCLLGQGTRYNCASFLVMCVHSTGVIATFGQLATPSTVYSSHLMTVFINLFHNTSC